MIGEPFAQLRFSPFISSTFGSIHRGWTKGIDCYRRKQLAYMKRFLLQNADNKKWFESQEKKDSKRLKSESLAKLFRREMYPELLPAKRGDPVLRHIDNGLLIEARQRTLHRRLMEELLARNASGKKTVTKNRTMTWDQRSKAIFFHMCPGLGNQDLDLTCMIFGVNAVTFGNWLKKKKFFPKWSPVVSKLTVADVLEDVAQSHRSSFENVDGSVTVLLPHRFTVNGSDMEYVSARSGSPQALRKKAAQSDSLVYITKSCKSSGTGRKTKYPLQVAFLVDSVVKAWECGNPMSKSVLYDALISEFGHDEEANRSEWEKVMSIHSGFISPAFSQWVRRVLERHRFSVRKESISQTVPLNWNTLCIEAAGVIRSTMARAGVDRLINADEMFLNYYPKDKHLIAPRNVKRVGTNRAEDDKKGCTVMVSCKMTESRLLAPYLVMTGTRDGYLARRFASHDGPAEVTFHPKHWMDKQGYILYLQWLASCYPDEKVGLVWDAASSHLSQDVTKVADELGITLGFIPGGCTSLLQICDLVLNKPPKQSFKEKYVSWKIRSDPGPGGKYKVDRKDIIGWLEHSTEDLSDKLMPTKVIEKAFKKYGQDFRTTDASELDAWLVKNEENGIYKSLLDNQSAFELQ